MNVSPRSIGFCQFEPNWVHTHASALPARNDDAVCVEQFRSKQLISDRERDCQRARRLTRLPCLRLLLARLLRQAQLSDTARNFPSFSSTM